MNGLNAVLTDRQGGFIHSAWMPHAPVNDAPDILFFGTRVFIRHANMPDGSIVYRQATTYALGDDNLPKARPAEGDDE